jgi:hypothetical protein
MPATAPTAIPAIAPPPIDESSFATGLDVGLAVEADVALEDEVDVGGVAVRELEYAASRLSGEARLNEPATGSLHLGWPVSLTSQQDH